MSDNQTSAPPIDTTIELKKNLNEAFAKAQAKFKIPELNRTAKIKKNGVLLYETQYADLKECIECIRGPLAENGLSFTQKITFEFDAWCLVLELKHLSGEIDRSFLPINVEQENQHLGGELTYLKRYQISAYFGLAADFDDDGNAGTGNQVEGKPNDKSKAKPAQQQVPKNHAPGATNQQDDPADFVIPFGKETKGKKIRDLGQKQLEAISKWTDEQIKNLKPGQSPGELMTVKQNIQAFLKSVGIS